MARVIPLGYPKVRGGGEAIRSALFTGDLVAGVAVSRVETTGKEPKVKAYNGSNFWGFSTADLNPNTKSVGVVRRADALPVRVKSGESLSIGDQVALDNATGEVVAEGTSGSTPIPAEVEETDITGLDENGKEVADCILINLYGGLAGTPTAYAAPQTTAAKRTTSK